MIQNLSSVVSTPTTPLENQLETCLDEVQATIASLVEASKHHKHGCSKTECRATHSRLDDSLPRRDKSSSKGKFTHCVTQSNTCSYEHYRRPTTHETEDCLFAKLAAGIGADP